MFNFIIKVTSTFFFIGYSPLIPGTATSFVAMFIIWFLKNYPPGYILATLAITILGFIVSAPAEKIFNKKDDRRIVIDEVSGMLVSFLFLPGERITVFYLFLGFILFRAFDAFKIYPANKLQRLSGSLGVMSDDLLAGLYTNIILQIALRFASCRIS